MQARACAHKACFFSWKHKFVHLILCSPVCKYDTTEARRTPGTQSEGSLGDSMYLCTPCFFERLPANRIFAIPELVNASRALRIHCATAFVFLLTAFASRPATAFTHAVCILVIAKCEFFGFACLLASNAYPCFHRIASRTITIPLRCKHVVFSSEVFLLHRDWFMLLWIPLVAAACTFRELARQASSSRVSAFFETKFYFWPSSPALQTPRSRRCLCRFLF